MDSIVINEKIAEVLLDNGVNFLASDLDEEILMDSIEFVSVIVSLETEFEIEVPDEYLLMDSLKTMSQYSNLVHKLISEIRIREID